MLDRDGPACRIRERPCVVAFRAVSLVKVAIAVAMVPMSRVFEWVDSWM